LNTNIQQNRIIQKRYPDKPPLGQALWLFLGMLALVLSASCGADVSGGFGGGGGIGGTAGAAGCVNGACNLNDDNSANAIGERTTDPANDALAQPLPTNAIACTKDTDCASGFCTDGVCCNYRCDDKCMACTAAKKGGGIDGECDSIAYDTDPDNECADGDSCDGNNVCKQHNGTPCTLWSQCLSNYCVDGFCCNNYCDGECQACSAVKKGNGSNGECGQTQPGTDPDNECNPGSCYWLGKCSSQQTKLPLGSACISAAQCSSGQCADGVCCDFLCVDRPCQACTAAKKGGGVDGYCEPIKYDTDPDNECWGGACNGEGMCKRYNNQPCSLTSQCLSNYCVDGVCCGNHCMDGCNACTFAKTGVEDGKCKPILVGTDPDNECNPGECTASGACSAPQPNPKQPGEPCSSGPECQSGFCADGVCCNNWCLGECQACTAAKKGYGSDGTCAPVKLGLDTERECNGGVCDGQGYCRNTNGAPCTASDQCFSNYCVEGICCGNICNLTCESCMASKKGGGNDGECGPIAAYTDPDDECADPLQCNGSKECKRPNGAACIAGSQCISGNCIDGVCCESSCGGGATNDCQACNVAGSLGMCRPRPVNDVCRPALAGGCDVAEVCNGISTSCPLDKYEPSGKTCRVANGDCDAIETCTGGSPLCPADLAKPDGTICRSKNGDCDLAETCNGITKTCPNDGFVLAGTVCRPETDACDTAETCTGAGPTCPPDIVKPAGTTCRASAGVCDIAETCNGTSKQCPMDGFAPTSQPCRLAIDLCDADDYCPGNGVQCPDVLKSVGTPCRPAGANSICDPGETCNGANRECPTNQYAKAGTVCGNEFCSNAFSRNHMDVCDGAGTCFNGGALNCPDGCFGTQCLSGKAIMPYSGIWHNPGRPGWFLHVSRNNNNNVLLLWFTYRPDGSPIWYLNLTQENDGKFRPVEPLYNCTWDWVNDKRVVVVHGSMTLTTASSTSGVISWVLDGVAWQEPVQWYSFDSTGQAPYLTGGWYPPNEPTSKGPSPTVTVQGDSLLATIATYEMNGEPTWVHQTGTSVWNGTAFNAMLAKRQGVNLCPGCAGVTSFSNVNVGSMTLRNFYDGGGLGFPDSGLFDVSFTAASGLSTWNRSSLPILRLTF
jgi:hypothetical protein